jgi:hypothetical protein
MTVENKGGRPLKFKTVEELQEKIDNYFKFCDENKKPYLVTTLALFLNTTRETLTDYQVKDGFSDTLKIAKQKIMSYAEEQLFKSQGQVAGPIFSLTNNYSQYYKNKLYTQDETDYTEIKAKLELLRKKTNESV